jgi:hypothetical protein
VLPSDLKQNQADIALSPATWGRIHGNWTYITACSGRKTGRYDALRFDACEQADAFPRWPHPLRVRPDRLADRFVFAILLQSPRRPLAAVSSGKRCREIGMTQSWKPSRSGCTGIPPLASALVKGCCRCASLNSRSPRRTGIRPGSRKPHMSGRFSTTRIDARPANSACTSVRLYPSGCATYSGVAPCLLIAFSIS